VDLAAIEKNNVLAINYYLSIEVITMNGNTEVGFDSYE